MLATAAPPPVPVPSALAVLCNAHDLLVRATLDTVAARQRVRVSELDRRSARAMAAVGRALQQVDRIEGECAEIRRAAGGIVWELAL